MSERSPEVQSSPEAGIGEARVGTAGEHRHERVALSRQLLEQVQRIERMLVGAVELPALLEVLLVNLPRHLGFAAVELWLYDPEGVLAGLIDDSRVYERHLIFHRDVFTLQGLYDLEPVAQHIAATDPRMFEVLKTEERVDGALLLPLLDRGRMLGSLHCAIAVSGGSLGEAELAFVDHLAALVAVCLRNAVSRQQLSRLTMLDPLTHISNLRGFERDIARELARAGRAEQPVAVMMLEIDDFDGLYRDYGAATGQFLVRKVSERVSSLLRISDGLARLARARLAILVPGGSEAMAADIAERIRRDIERFSIDDGRGASLQLTLSIGFVSWEAQRFPAVDMAQLARQVEAAADKALATARDGGGNQSVMHRLTALMV